VLAFSRSYGNDRIVVAVGRHFASLTDQGRDWPTRWQSDLKLTMKHRGNLRDALSGAECSSLEISRALSTLPVAILRSR
jgi:maltooligosyltrehalose synthase